MSGKYVHYMALVLSSYNRFIISNSSHQYQVKTDSQTSFFIEILTYQIYNSTKKTQKSHALPCATQSNVSQGQDGELSLLIITRSTVLLNFIEF